MSTPRPRFEKDTFISYRHDNNLLLDENEKGWVDNFHERLEIQLTELIGRKALVWRDERLPRNVTLVSYLDDRIKESVVLVSVISPGYVSSTWCMGELRQFCNHAADNGGLYLNGRSRLFAVVKLPVDTHPAEFAGQLTYDFFERPSTSDKPEEFRQDVGRNRDQRYWNTLFTLAWEIKEVLRESERLAAPVSPESNIFIQPDPPLKKTVYLAETTEDLKEERRQIKEELVLHGYNVLPNSPSPYTAGAYREAVKKNLQGASLSIHLLGRSYGLIPDGAGDSSIVQLQVELAAEQARRPGFMRLHWMPVGWEAGDSKLNGLLSRVKLTADPRKGMEFWQTSLEEFKTLMHKRLNVNGHRPAPETAAETAAAGAGHLKVYLVCDPRDLLDAAPLITHLHREKGYEVVLPEFDDEGGDALLTNAHQNNLLECDAVIVYYGHAGSRWLSAKKSDLEKFAGIEKVVESGRARPLRAKAFYVAPPHNALKEVFFTHVAPVIKNFGEFSPACLKDFIDQLEGGSPDNTQGGGDNE
jgi:hypothetical protein